MTSNLTPQTPTPSIPSLLASQQPAPMPQFILASGQLVQGIQGAQLLIPTSQGKIDFFFGKIIQKLNWNWSLFN